MKCNKTISPVREFMNGLLSFKPTNNDCDFARIAKKQDQMFHRVATLCPERAEIITDSFKRSEGNRSLFAAPSRWPTFWKK
jgi:hypothetical protein